MSKEIDSMYSKYQKFTEGEEVFFCDSSFRILDRLVKHYTVYPALVKEVGNLCICVKSNKVSIKYKIINKLDDKEDWVEEENLFSSLEILEHLTPKEWG